MNAPAPNPAPVSAPFRNIGVVGSGAMGRGIAQLFAQSGSNVHLHDSNPAALASAVDSIAATFAMLAGKGRLSPSEAEAARARIHAVDALAGLAGCDLVIEAIVERLDVKRELFVALEAI
ncbi:MAG: 3-hydroxyacyl-CoA dehydrogenase, partial [Burkholderiaceae bacterium]|nr:3-hydroxyacyl-CoA dehydrogenase [Burkholderiaceae bacterium]